MVNVCLFFKICLVVVYVKTKVVVGQKLERGAMMMEGQPQKETRDGHDISA
jgi:hypothetical protein